MFAIEKFWQWCETMQTNAWNIYVVRDDSNTDKFKAEQGKSFF